MVLYPTWAQDGQAPCTRKGQLSRGRYVLAITLQLQVVTCRCPLRTSARPRPVTHPGVLWLCTHGIPTCWSFLNAVQESGRRGRSVPASGTPPTQSVHKFLTAHQLSAKLHSALIVRRSSWGRHTQGRSTVWPDGPHACYMCLIILIRETETIAVPHPSGCEDHWHAPTMGSLS